MKPSLVIDDKSLEVLGFWVIVLGEGVCEVPPADVLGNGLFVVLPADKLGDGLAVKLLADVLGEGLFVLLTPKELGDALFVVLPAGAELPGSEHAAPSVASARLWMPSALFGHRVGCGNVRESTVVYATLKFDTKFDQFCTWPFSLSAAAPTSVLIDVLSLEAVLVMSWLLLSILSVIQVE